MSLVSRPWDVRGVEEFLTFYTGAHFKMERLKEQACSALNVVEERGLVLTPSLSF
jgi:hypothetical protein